MAIFLESLTRKERVLIVIVIVLSIVLAYFGYSAMKGKNQTPLPMDETVLAQPEAEDETEEGVKKDQLEQASILMVDVKGAVRTPGVYQITNGKRVNDVIVLAGGFTDEADPNAINLAKVLSDEMVIYVPEKGETNSIPASSPQLQEDGKVNINEAELPELQEIPGIGPTKAGAIIQYRDDNGPFQSIEDLLNVPGIGEKTLEQMKAEITI